jgi:hypothetical protein
VRGSRGQNKGNWGFDDEYHDNSWNFGTLRYQNLRKDKLEHQYAAKSWSKLNINPRASFPSMLNALAAAKQSNGIMNQEPNAEPIIHPHVSNT